jgi:hypothetical protein
MSAICGRCATGSEPSNPTVVMNSADWIFTTTVIPEGGRRQETGDRRKLEGYAVIPFRNSASDRSMGAAA